MKITKKLSVSKILLCCFIISIFYTIFAIQYKIRYFGFSINPNAETNVWLVEGVISYTATGEPIKLTLNAPNNSTIIGDSITTEGYEITENKLKHRKVIELTAEPKKAGQEEKVYYRVLLLENAKLDKVETNNEIPSIDIPYFDETQKNAANKLLTYAKSRNSGDIVSNLIRILNQKPSIEEVQTFIPLKVDQTEIFNITKSILSLENIPVRMIRGVTLQENKSLQKPDLLLEAYVNGEWKIYNLENGKVGIPDNFLIFQNGGESLLDVEGGKNSKIVFSVLKNKYNTLFLSKYKAKTNSLDTSFKYSMFNLPVREQNMLKIITVFPLAILSIVILRNIIGIKTLGTFTPMLIAMSFIQTGLINGLLAFTFLITVGLLIRRVFSKIRLLLVPRISSIVILVIFLIQIITVVAYNLNIEIGLSLLFFPLIITAWIIERSSIVIDESGEKTAIKQNIITLIVATFTYLVISSEQIRYIMYVFNEINISILFLIMLIGTYTGYRLTEIKRFQAILNK